MTTQEAIRYLQRVVDFAALNGGSEAFQIALDALLEKAAREENAPEPPSNAFRKGVKPAIAG